MQRKIALVTDSSASIPSELAQELQVLGGFFVVPLLVDIEDENTSDLSESELNEQIALAQVLGKRIQTASPSVGKFERVYRKLLEEGYEKILSIHISSDLSSTYDVARVAAQQFEDKVFVVDSRTVALALGWAVIKAHELAGQSEDARELAETMLEICENIQLYFYIPTLDALKRGGRVSPALARVAQLFQIRPVATVENGKLIYIERPRTSERAQQLLAEHVLTEARRRRIVDFPPEHDLTPPVRGELIGAHYSGNRSELMRWLEDNNFSRDILISPLPAVLSAHTGLGALAVVIY